jgi:hypothetical protein
LRKRPVRFGSLLRSKYTENNSELSISGRAHHQFMPRFQRLADKFPVQPNREGVSSQQRIFSARARN